MLVRRKRKLTRRKCVRSHGERCVFSDVTRVPATRPLGAEKSETTLSAGVCTPMSLGVGRAQPGNHECPSPVKGPRKECWDRHLADFSSAGGGGEVPIHDEGVAE